jgi:hypothetical protein
VSRKRRHLSEKDKLLFGARALLILGHIFLVLALAISAEFLWLGIPKTTTLHRLFFGVVVGATLCTVGFRLASKTWQGSLQPLLRACAGAGILFLGIVLKINLQSAHRAIPPVWLLVLAGSPLLWLLIRRTPRPRRHEKPA